MRGFRGEVAIVDGAETATSTDRPVRETTGDHRWLIRWGDAGGVFRSARGHRARCLSNGVRWIEARGKAGGRGFARIDAAEAPESSRSDGFPCCVYGRSGIGGQDDPAR